MFKKKKEKQLRQKQQVCKGPGSGASLIEQIAETISKQNYDISFHNKNLS